MNESKIVLFFKSINKLLDFLKVQKQTRKLVPQKKDLTAKTCFLFHFYNIPSPSGNLHPEGEVLR